MYTHRKKQKQKQKEYVIAHPRKETLNKQEQARTCKQILRDANELKNKNRHRN